MRTITPFLFVLFLMACGSGGTDSAALEGENATAETNEAPKGVLTDLSSEDLPLDILCPEGTEPLVVWREEFGHVEVRAGENFGVMITEQPGDVARKKADLSRDLLQTHTFIVEEENGMVYKSQFPDNENLVFHHFYEVITIGDREFIVSDLPDGQFSETQAKAMMGSVRAKASS